MTVLIAEVVTEINAFRIFDRIGLDFVMLAIATASPAATASAAAACLLWIIGNKTKKCIRLNFFLSITTLFVLHFQMRLKLLLRPKGHEALSFANLVRADEVREGEMGLQITILFVMNIFVVVCAEMARIMLPIQMIKKRHIIKEKFFAKVAIWMRQYFSMSVVSEIALFDVGAEGVDVVEPLLPYENRPALKTNLAESFLVASFEMALEGSTIWELLFGTWAIVNQAIQRSELQSSLFGCVIVEVNCVVFRVFFTLLLELLVEEFPRECFVIGYNDFIQISSAHRAFFVFQDESEAQRARYTYILMTTGSHSEKLELIVA